MVFGLAGNLRLLRSGRRLHNRLWRAWHGCLGTPTTACFSAVSSSLWFLACWLACQGFSVVLIRKRPKASLSFCRCLGFLVLFLWYSALSPTPWPYFRVCVSVAVFLLTETSLYFQIGFRCMFGAQLWDDALGHKFRFQFRNSTKNANLGTRHGKHILEAC